MRLFSKLNPTSNTNVITNALLLLQVGSVSADDDNEIKELIGGLAGFALVIAGICCFYKCVKAYCCDCNDDPDNREFRDGVNGAVEVVGDIVDAARYNIN